MSNPTYHGLEMRWSTNGVSSTAFGSGTLIQSIDAENQLSEAEYPNQQGNTIIWTGYNFKKTATFEMIPATNGSADGQLVITTPTIGIMFTVIDSINGNSLVAGTNWILQSVTERSMATDLVKWTIRATAYPLITT